MSGPSGGERRPATAWARDAIFYHVYPLGLCDAPRRNDFGAPPVPRLELLSGWLDHVRWLGADALYLGPVFESTAHGYDTADYYRVDRRLGTADTLRDVVAHFHQGGVRVVLDTVFNHVGRDFWAFRDVQLRGEASAYRDWFDGLRFDGRSPYGDPFVYQGWHGAFDLVKLNLGNRAVREHLFGAVESWLRDFDVDGLRLDAADDVDPGFQRELAAFCRDRRPDFFLLGEVVHGDYRRWANADMLDSVTNYEAYKGLYSSLNDRNYFEIAYALEREFGEHGLYRDLPLYNFADNHDVDRVASVIRDRRLLLPLYGLLFTMPGVPSVYYGSEWAIEGRRARGDDGPVRPALPSPAAAAERGTEPALAATIARLAAIRRASPALRQGAYRQLHVAHEQLAFARETGADIRLVLLNAAPEPARFDVPAPRDGEWHDSFRDVRATAIRGRLELDVPGFSAAVLSPR